MKIHTLAGPLLPFVNGALVADATDVKTWREQGRRVAEISVLLDANGDAEQPWEDWQTQETPLQIQLAFRHSGRTTTTSGVVKRVALHGFIGRHRAGSRAESGTEMIVTLFCKDSAFA